MDKDEDDYGTGGLMDEPDDYYPPTPPPTKQVYTMNSGRNITLHLVGQSPTEAHHLWNGAKVISDYFESDPSRVKGKTVLELGAASGLPSLVAGILGATKVVMTDFPDPDIVNTMQKNIYECDAAWEPQGHITETIDAMGFVWGAEPAALLARLRHGHHGDDIQHGQDSTTDSYSPPQQQKGFDVVILADLLFRHSEHGALVKTIKETMRRDRTTPEEGSASGRAYVFFTSYRPWKKDMDMAFFDLARSAGLRVEQVLERKLDKPLFENDPGDLEVQKTVKGFELRWPDTSPA